MVKRLQEKLCQWRRRRPVIVVLHQHQRPAAQSQENPRLRPMLDNPPHPGCLQPVGSGMPFCLLQLGYLNSIMSGLVTSRVWSLGQLPVHHVLVWCQLSTRQAPRKRKVNQTATRLDFKVIMTSWIWNELFLFQWLSLVTVAGSVSLRLGLSC